MWYRESMHLIRHLGERYMRVAKFVIVGGCATTVTISALFILNTIFDVWYVTSSIVAFLAGFFVSFTLQKFWTFQDRGLGRTAWQLAVYLVITLANLILNTILVYVFVEFFIFVPVVAQLCASALIAFESFFAYRTLVFFGPTKADFTV